MEKKSKQVRACTSRYWRKGVGLTKKSSRSFAGPGQAPYFVSEKGETQNKLETDEIPGNANY